MYKYILISPNNELYCFTGKTKLIEFIVLNNLSFSKFRSSLNKGIITSDNIRLVNNYYKIKTINCIGWNIKSYKYNIEWDEIYEIIKKETEYNDSWGMVFEAIKKQK